MCVGVWSDVGRGAPGPGPPTHTTPLTKGHNPPIPQEHIRGGGIMWVFFWGGGEVGGMGDLVLLLRNEGNCWYRVQFLNRKTLLGLKIEKFGKTNAVLVGKTQSPPPPV